jgi:hypothetical protein
MNYIATQIIAYYLYIKGGGSNVIQPVEYGNFPIVGTNRYLVNIVIVAVLTIVMYVYLKYSKDGYEINGARICADTLYLPSDFKGEVNILYKRRPEALCIDYPDAEIDIPRSTENLLPLLVASYLWLDDDPDKAQYYMQLYRDEMARLKRYIPSVIGGGYQDVTGWA